MLIIIIVLSSDVFPLAPRQCIIISAASPYIYIYNNITIARSSSMKVTVIGLGAMGGGMARSLLKCPAVDEIAGFDLSKIVVTTFFNDAKGK